MTTQEQGDQVHLHTNRPARRAAVLELHPPSVAIVTLLGKHDLVTKQKLTEALAQASEHSNVLVDLCDCAFIDFGRVQRAPASPASSPTPSQP